MGQSLERARDHRTTTFVRSSIFRSFVRVLLLTTLDEKTRNLTQVPSLALNDLGPGSNLPPVELDLGFVCFFFFSPLFLLPPSTLAPHPTAWDLGQVHPLSFPLLFLSFNINPPPIPSFTSLFGTNLFCLYALFIVLGKNSGLDKFAILTYPSQCLVLEKFCHFF